MRGLWDLMSDEFRQWMRERNQDKLIEAKGISACHEAKTNFLSHHPEVSVLYNDALADYVFLFMEKGRTQKYAYFTRLAWGADSREHRLRRDGATFTGMSFRSIEDLERALDALKKQRE